MLSTNVAQQHALVMGYGVTGRSVADFLLTQGAHVTVIDRGDSSDDPSVTLLLQKGARFVWGEHPLELVEEPFDFVVKNPGISYYTPFVQALQEKEIPIYTDVELAYLFSEAAIIGITGSNGKTTTTSLIHQLLQGSTEKGEAFLAGNIGVPALDVVARANPNDTIVMELSSFQLKGTEQFKPTIAVITNIFEAHIDYHKTRDDYVTSKLNLIRHLTLEDHLVYNYDSSELRQLLASTMACKVPFAVDCIDDDVRRNGVYVEGDSIFFRGEEVAQVTDILIPGKHNLENALAAIAVAKLNQVANAHIVQVLRTYSGMPHRIQKIASHKGVDFYNDSKSTNTTAAITALNSFKQPIVYIGGGLDRGDDLSELVPHLEGVKVAHLYGESKMRMQTLFKQVCLHDNLVEATEAAYRDAQVGDVVLLSPSCASWDQFKNFEERGNLFVETVQQLIAKENEYEGN
ncbi:UDP-N-acetylmuramoyl-L-alanine--D-glutamate ligase [Aerococcaceae bacterium NML171108]|nr:UDP-N-acetylmuramoyl-L-alanine--D-glutamate ligase [Aerococcaceae bacterium NML171108]